MVLAIDIGGTSSKFGFVNEKGDILRYRKFDTAAAVRQYGLGAFLEKEIGECLAEEPRVEGIGIGLPGLLSVDRRDILELPNVELEERLPVVELLSSRFPGIPVRIENDAKCAALGEYYYGRHRDLESFLLVTLGTGIGSGLVIGGQLFPGARGNGLELGHILVGRERTLEEQIGLKGFLARAREQMGPDFPFRGKENLPGKEAEAGKVTGEQPEASRDDGLSAKDLYEAALAGDPRALSLFAYMGELLGEGLVAAVRLLDVTSILLGGGVAGAFDFIVPELKKRLHRHLPEYYTSALFIAPASLGNHAGLLGAASLFRS